MGLNYQVKLTISEFSPDFKKHLLPQNLQSAHRSPPTVNAKAVQFTQVAKAPFPAPDISFYTVRKKIPCSCLDACSTGIGIPNRMSGPFASGGLLHALGMGPVIGPHNSEPNPLRQASLANAKVNHFFNTARFS